MTAPLRSRTGGRILVDQLLVHGADRAFCVPGESYLEVLDALHDEQGRFHLHNARHEAGAANMAEAWAKLTGKPGICMVTRGPGACHASIGVHIARQDSTPMILLIGQVGRGMMDREAFQEIDYRAMFAPVAKWAAQIEDPARIPEYMARAFRVATSGRPGPVVLALPEDMLTSEAVVPDAAPYAPTRAEMSAASAAKIAAAVATAEKPLLLVGGSGWDDAAAAAIQGFAERNGLPVISSFRRQDVVHNGSEIWVGELGTATAPKLRARMAEADLLLVIGARLGEMTTNGYEGPAAPFPAQRVIHVHPDADEIGRVYAPELGFAAAQGEAAAALAEIDMGRAAAWEDWRRMLRDEWLADVAAPNGGEWELDMSVAITRLRETLPPETIATFDAGNHTGWGQRYLRFGRPGRQLGSTCGAMGYAVPAAVAAAITRPEALSLAFVGDGGFMMHGQELATAVQYGAAPIVLLFNNSIYGTIRMHQEREHPERISGTQLVNGDFVKMAEGLGCYAERVTRTGDFMEAFARARASGRAAVLELVTDPERISTRTTISALRARAKG